MKTYEIDGIVVTDLRLVVEDMVGCTLILGGDSYDCAEYFDNDGHVLDDADAHMSVNGILNKKTGRMEPFVSNGMESDDYVLWTNAETVVRGAMQVFVTDKLFPSAAA